jgi:hypothetical protein
MKRFAGLICGCAFVQLVCAQTIDLKMLNGLLRLNQPKLETHLQKKGFKKAGAFAGEAGFAKTNSGKSGNVIQLFQILPAEAGYDLVYKTTSQTEYAELEKELRSAGFYYSTRQKNCGTSLYQKKDLVLKCYFEQLDSVLFYVLCASKKQLPKPKDIAFAEDLLQLDSHEYLAEAFGRQNIKNDIFPLSLTESKKCTIIFPNTSRQAIFLWNDEENLRDISLIIIGEQLHTDKNLNAVMLSNWRSSQGVYCGMSLREMENLNKEPILFYNWRTETAGFLAPKNKGAIDFTRLKPVFNCMNCNFLQVDAEVDIIQSNYSIDENQKVYVASFVLLPEKKIDVSGQTSFK